MTPFESETGHWLRAEVEQLLDRVLRDVAAARNQAELALERVLAALQHLVGEIDAAVAGGFRTNQRSAPAQAFARQDAREFIAQPLVLAEQEADLASANADVPGRHVGVRSDVALQFGHEALAEPHDFVVALSFGIEIRSALAAAHGQRGQRILEDLFEGQEFQDAEVDAGMEAQSALVGADGAVHLDAESTVNLNVALVIEPRHAEHKDALGLDDTFEQTRRLVLGVLGEDQPERVEHFCTAWWNSGSAGFFAFTLIITDSM